MKQSDSDFKVTLEKALTCGKAIRQQRHGSHEIHKMVDDIIIVEPYLGGRKLTNGKTYKSFDDWFTGEVINCPDDDFEILI